MKKINNVLTNKLSFKSVNPLLSIAQKLTIEKLEIAINNIVENPY